MARPRDRHPLGKRGEWRFEMTMPSAFKPKAHVVASINGKDITTWAREVLEKAIEGEWSFIQRRVIGTRQDPQDMKLPEESPDA